MSDPPAGWYPDTQQRGQQRYWDGTQWTEHVHIPPLFDAQLAQGFTTIRTKYKQMVITHEELVWGDQRIRWDEVTWFTQLTTQMSGFDVEYQVTFQCGDRVEPVVFGARVKRDPIGTRAYEIIIDQLRRTIGARVYAGVMEMVDRGEPVRLGGLVLSPQGFAQEDKGDEVQPWTTYAGVEVTGHHAPFIEIFRVRDDGKRKRACRVMVDMLRGWVIPPIVEEHVRRYGT